MLKTLVSLAMIVVCAIAGAKTHHSSTSKSVKRSGCVESAVENSCHVVIDSKTSGLYNLLFSAKAPKSGSAITFIGIAHKGTTACLQGQVRHRFQVEKGRGYQVPSSGYCGSNSEEVNSAKP